MVIEANGVCPHCEAYTGPIGTPCIRPECAKGGYNCIPIRWYDAAKAYSARKDKPIDPLVGRMIERYLLAGNIGEGGMGSVYVAIQKPLFREVALKLIQDIEMNRHSVGRFEREARAISALDHPNIVKIHDYGIGDLDKKVPFMALEYLRHGRTLRKAFAIASESGKVDGGLVLLIFRQVLNALGAAHAVGIVHRDVKPENVMVVPVHGDPNLVKVLDFGLARMDSDDTSFEGDAMAAGRLAGTPFYMAPEQIPHKGTTGEVDGRADLYAVGVMLYEVLTGTRPFEGDSPLAVLARKLDPSFDPMALPPAKALAKGIRAFLAKALARAPGDRYATASEMLEALEKVLETRAAAVGLVIMETASSSDRIEAPSDSPSGPSGSPGPSGTSAPPADAPVPPAAAPSAPPAPVGPGPLDPLQADPKPRPEPVSPIPPRGGLGMQPSWLELDMPERPKAPPLDVLPEAPLRTAGSTQPDLAVRPELRTASPLPRPKSPALMMQPPRTRSAGSKPGFSSTTLVIAGISLAVVLALIPWVTTQVRMASAREAMLTLRTGLVQGGRLVGFENGLLRPTQGTDYEVLGPEGPSGPRIPQNDPWGHPYTVRYQLDKKVYVLRSMGPDGVEGACPGDDPDTDDLCVLLAGR